MMEALQQSRQQNPISSGPVPGNPAPQPTPGNPGVDMAKLSSSVDEISAKLDKVLEAMSAQYRGKESMPDEENDGNEAK